MTDPIDELLAGLRDDVPEMSDHAFTAGRARLQAIVAPEPVMVEPKEPAVVPLREKRLLRSPPRRLIASAAAAVVLAVGVVAGQAVWSGDNAPVASAAEQLNAAAEKAGATDESLRSGQYRYSATHSWILRPIKLNGVEVDFHENNVDNMEFAVQEERVREEWRSADPQVQCTVRGGYTGERKWLVGSEEAAKKADVGLHDRKINEFLAYCGGDMSLPSDPQEVYDQLVAGGEISSVRMVESIATMLETSVSADDRALLYRVLAMVPDLKVTEQVANVDGQKGTAYGASANGEQYDVIVDPATGRFIGDRLISEDGNLELGVGDVKVPAGTVIKYTSFTGPLIVDKVGATS